MICTVSILPKLISICCYTNIIFLFDRVPPKIAINSSCLQDQRAPIHRNVNSGAFSQVSWFGRQHYSRQQKESSSSLLPLLPTREGLSLQPNITPELSKRELSKREQCSALGSGGPIPCGGSAIAVETREVQCCGSRLFRYPPSFGLQELLRNRVRNYLRVVETIQVWLKSLSVPL